MKVKKLQCDGNVSVKIENLYDDRYAYPGKYTMLKCDSNNHLELDADLPVKN